MKIGYVAAKMGIPASTIRYYEKVGLIEPPQRISGARSFPASVMHTLRFIQLAQTAGFELSEMKVLLDQYDGKDTTKAMWQTLAEIKQQDIRAQIKILKKMDRVLSNLMDCRCPTLNECVDAAQSAHHAKTKHPIPIKQRNRK